MNWSVEFEKDLGNFISVHDFKFKCECHGIF